MLLSPFFSPLLSPLSSSSYLLFQSVVRSLWRVHLIPAANTTPLHFAHVRVGDAAAIEWILEAVNINKKISVSNALSRSRAYIT